jgi:hypothetical protein
MSREIHNRNFRLIHILDSARIYILQIGETTSIAAVHVKMAHQAIRLDTLNKRLLTFSPWMVINEQKNCYRLRLTINIYSLAFLILEFIFRELARNLLAVRDRREICRRGEILRRGENRQMPPPGETETEDCRYWHRRSMIPRLVIGGGV